MLGRASPNDGHEPGRLLSVGLLNLFQSLCVTTSTHDMSLIIPLSLEVETESICELFHLDVQGSVCLSEASPSEVAMFTKHWTRSKSSPQITISWSQTRIPMNIECCFPWLEEHTRTSLKTISDEHGQDPSCGRSYHQSDTNAPRKR